MNTKTTKITTHPSHTKQCHPERSRGAKLETQNLCWYAIYTKPRFEKKVDKVLTEAGYEVCLPLMSTIRQWSDRKKKVQAPLIPSYVFVKMAEKQLQALFEFTGVVGVLKHLKKPAVVQDYEIENLKIMCQHPDAVTAIDIAEFEPGTPIQIIHGPMIGLYGDCIEIKGKQRMLVSVKNMGLAFVLDVPLSYIEGIKSPLTPEGGRSVKKMPSRHF